MIYIFVEVRFGFSMNRNVQNDTRRYLMGLKSPKVPEKVNEAVGWPALHPITFGYIKEKGVRKGAGYNRARGAVVIYLYGGRDAMLDRTIRELDAVLSSLKTKDHLKWYSYSIYVGEDIVERTYPYEPIAQI
ncbi:hypothetical protein [Candidatus Methanodesulfokora washburnensis]|uniref:Uncharacterized protein n=1 Tax=Candidatus Methanodesulfokora washburnensis TaxID=2478471 RepID=A0A429GEP8_9CREN|nr:hypothetical protein [Candidatus Methanodesulfokores washburnensis]RSN72282.1 hypothetical protein D6D85_14515 [Candidatus Methanodesulfokores washburnensis]